MTKFEPLLYKRPNEERDRLVSERITESLLQSWQAGLEIPQEKDRLLVGYVTWSRYDLALLDRLQAFKEEQTNDDLVVHVFNFDYMGESEYFDFRDSIVAQRALEKYVPGLELRKIHHTPVVGFWMRGVLQWTDFGYLAREKIDTILEQRRSKPTS